MWPRMHHPMGPRMPMMPVQMGMPPMQQMHLGHMAAAGAMMGIAAPSGGMGMQMPYHMQMGAHRFGFQPSPLDSPFAPQFDVPPIVGDGSPPLQQTWDPTREDYIVAVETMGSEKQSALSGPSAPSELPWPGPRHARTPAAENEFAELLLRRAQDLVPTPIEQQALAALSGRVTAALDRLVVAPKQFEAAQIEEFRIVGSHKKGTMLTKKNTADIVVVLKTLPTKEAVLALGRKLVEELRVPDSRDPLALQSTDAGFVLLQSVASVRVLITTTVPNIELCEPPTHLEKKKLLLAHAAMRHARWFEENASHASVKTLVRLLKDLRVRFEGLSELTVWMLELLAHHCVMVFVPVPVRAGGTGGDTGKSPVPLPIGTAFRRALQLLAAGIFLPGSQSICDPCEKAEPRIHTMLSLEAQDQICFTAQTLVRVLLHGGVRAVLGLEGHLGAIASEMSVWAGVVVMPSERAYARPPDEEPEDAEMPQATPVAAAPSASVPAQSAAAAAQVVASAAAAVQVVASAAAATRPAQPTPPAAVAVANKTTVPAAGAAAGTSTPLAAVPAAAKVPTASPALAPSQPLIAKNVLTPQPPAVGAGAGAGVASPVAGAKREQMPPLPSPVPLRLPAMPPVFAPGGMLRPAAPGVFRPAPAPPSFRK